MKTGKGHSQNSEESQDQKQCYNILSSSIHAFDQTSSIPDQAFFNDTAYANETPWAVILVCPINCDHNKKHRDG